MRTVHQRRIHRRKRLDVRTLFESLEEPAVPAGLTERILQQVAAAGRPLAPAPSRALPFGIPRWSRLPLAVGGAAAFLLLTGAAWLLPSTWVAVLDGLQASLLGAVWLLIQAAAVLAKSTAFLGGAVRIREALDPVLNTSAATVALATVTLLCLAGVTFLHRLSATTVGQPRARSGRVGALLLVFGLCGTGLAFGQSPQEDARTAREEAQEEAAAAIEEVRERLDAALEGAGERAQNAVQDAIERIEHVERELAETEELFDLDKRVAFGSTVRVGHDEVAYDAIAIGGGVKVDGQVRGDAVAIGGEVKISGRVTEDVVAIGGDVELGPEAEVLGDVVTIGGKVSREDGATVVGEVSEVDWSDFEWNWQADWFDGWRGDWVPRVGERPPFFRAGRLFEFIRAVVFTGLLVSVCGLVLLVAPKGVDRIRSAAVTNPLTMLFAGLGVAILFLPALFVASLLLLVTIVGIPFAILLWPAALGALTAALVLGYTGSATAAGNWCRNRFRGASGIAAGSFGALALGVLTIQALALAADLLGFLGLPWFFRAMFGLPGLLILLLAWTIGLGAVFMTRFGTSYYVAGTAQPLPPTPPAGGDREAVSDTSDQAAPPPADTAEDTEPPAGKPDP